MEMKDKPIKVQTGSMILAVVLLAGILSIAYGHFQRSSLALTTGLIVTAAGVLVGILRIIIYRKA